MVTRVCLCMCSYAVVFGVIVAGTAIFFIAVTVAALLLITRRRTWTAHCRRCAHVFSVFVSLIASCWIRNGSRVTIHLVLVGRRSSREVVPRSKLIETRPIANSSMFDLLQRLSLCET